MSQKNELQVLSDEVWEIKAVVEDLETRKLSKPDALVYASVTRDLIRSKDRLIAVLDKYKRKPRDKAPAAPNEQAPLALGEGGEA